jgi:hypothetical protein
LQIQKFIFANISKSLKAKRHAWLPPLGLNFKVENGAGWDLALLKLRHGLASQSFFGSSFHFPIQFEAPANTKMMEF